MKTVIASRLQAPAARVRALAAAILKPKQNDEEGIHSLLRLGTILVLVLVGGIGVWLATANLAGAIIAPGIVVVESSIKKVQHQTGGIVKEIRVKDGDRVREGDLLLRLDPTVAGANLGVITAQLDELVMREARLKAERDGQETIELPVSMIGRADTPEVRDFLAGERKLFESRRTALAGQKAQLNERINQLNEQIGGIEGQGRAKAREVEFVKKELAEIEQLWEKRLTTLARVSALRRDAARIEGERAQLTASLALVKDRIVETRLQILQVDREQELEIAKELREVQSKQAALIEQRAAAQDQLQRVEIRSPQTGVVHQLSAHTVGGIVAAGEPIMFIVPDRDSLVVDARISPRDIDQVREGQSAYVRFTAFNQRTTPECNGDILRIAADLSKDTVTGEPFFAARVGLPSSEVRRLRELKLVPGMPAEVFIKTGDRTALSYFVRPLSDQFRRAFTED